MPSGSGDPTEPEDGHPPALRNLDSTEPTFEDLEIVRVRGHRVAGRPTRSGPEPTYAACAPMGYDQIVKTGLPDGTPIIVAVGTTGNQTETPVGARQFEVEALLRGSVPGEIVLRSTRRRWPSSWAPDTWLC